jgi:hypothetical protein
MALAPVVKKKPLVGLDAANPANYVPSDADVANNVSSVIRKGGPLMQLAETEGAKIASRRGLLSTSIAAGTAQNEVLRAATPIGSQTAAQNAQANLAHQQYGETSALGKENYGYDLGRMKAGYGYDLGKMRAGYGYDLGKMKAGYGYQRGLAEQGYGFDLGRMKAGYGYDVGKMKLDFQNQSGLQKSQFGFDASQKKLDRDLQREIATWNLDAADQDRVGSLLTSYQGVYEESLSQINANKNLKADARTSAINALNVRRQNYVSRLKSIYGIDTDISWPAASPVAAANPVATKATVKPTSGKAKPANQAAATLYKRWDWNANGGVGGYV